MVFRLPSPNIILHFASHLAVLQTNETYKKHTQVEATTKRFLFGWCVLFVCYQSVGVLLNAHDCDCIDIVRDHFFYLIFAKRNVRMMMRAENHVIILLI